MTNIEWLRTLSADELVDFINPSCNMCIYYGNCPEDCPCIEGKVKWLNAEHKPELKPCPFCGAEGDFINHDSNVFWVQCTNCGSHGRQSKTKEGAITAWNRRVDNAD